MDNVSSLLDKRTLITGASPGIGAAIARKLAKAGADIAMTYKRSTDKAGGLTLRSKGSLFTGWTGRPMKPVARALRVLLHLFLSVLFGPSAAF
jgi:NAD(P)-dependent dehydrogenase (short-subunit alcohol dehydrogenase family)